MAQQHSVVLCSDDVDRQPAVLAALQEAGYDVELSGSTTRLLLLPPRPDRVAIVIDLIGSPIQTFNLISRLRDQMGSEEVPILLVIDELRPSEVVRGLQAGATDCISRSLSNDELVSAVNRCRTRTPSNPPPEHPQDRVLASLDRVASPREDPSIPQAPPRFRMGQRAVVPSTNPPEFGSSGTVSLPDPIRSPFARTTPLPSAEPAVILQTVSHRNLLEGPLKDRIYQEILGRLDVGVVVVSTSHRIDYINRAARQIFEIWEPGSPVFPPRLAGLTRDTLFELLFRGDQDPIALSFEGSRVKAITGSMIPCSDQKEQTLGYIIMVCELREKPTSHRSHEDIQLTKELTEGAEKAGQSLNVLARMLQTLDREKVLSDPRTLRSFELMRHEMERLTNLIQQLKDHRSKGKTA